MPLHALELWVRIESNIGFGSDVMDLGAKIPASLGSEVDSVALPTFRR